MKARYILLDIEGTVSDIHFVKNVLFPYSQKKLASYITQHQVELEGLLSEVPGDDLGAKVHQFESWIEADIKAKPLKELQGRIWKQGFENGEFEAPIYADAKSQMEHWKESGLRLGIYSSGSVTAQKLFFKHTEHGDLTPLFENHFDLETGSKKETTSYQKIAKELQLEPEEILFLSDIEQELVAAKQAGLKVTQIVRPGTQTSEEIQWVKSFEDVEVSH